MPPRTPKGEFEGPNEDNWWRSDDESDMGDEVGRPAGAEVEDLYDEGQDEKDAKWVDETRQGRVSDAILSCPGCFTMLTVDCQQHAHHRNQFRAMLVTNCLVDEQRVLASSSGPAGKKAAGGQRKSKSAASRGSLGGPEPGGSGGTGTLPDPEERFHPVSCAVCGTEVGVRDSEEVYHFFHVFPSNA